MTFEQLEYFIAVAEHDTFFDAAEDLHITQSALSKQIMKMEKELGVTLLDRSHRSASLTDTGKLFLDEATKLLDQYHCTLSKIYTYQNQNNSLLRIGTLPIQTQYGLTLLFQKFKELHPDIRLEIEEVEESDLINGMEAGQFDLIITREIIMHSQNYDTKLLTEDELVAILPINHPLVQTDIPASIHLSDISKEDFILMNRYTFIHKICLNHFEQEGIAPRLVRTARPESIVSAVAVGEGVSLLARSNYDLFPHNQVVAVSLNPSVKLPVFLIARKNRKLPSFQDTDSQKKNAAKGTPLSLLIQFLTTSNAVHCVPKLKKNKRNKRK